jgi:hypothetical protein
MRKSAGAKERGRRGSIRRCIVRILRRAFAFTAANPSASNIDSAVTRIFSGLMLPFWVFVLRLQLAVSVSVTHAKKISSSHSKPLTRTWLVFNSFIL